MLAYHTLKSKDDSWWRGGFGSGDDFPRGRLRPVSSDHFLTVDAGDLRSTYPASFPSFRDRPRHRWRGGCELDGPGRGFST